MYNLNPKNKNECHSVNVKVVNLNVIDQDNNVGQGHKAEDEVKNVDMKVHSTSRFLLKKKTLLLRLFQKYMQCLCDCKKS